MPGPLPLCDACFHRLPRRTAFVDSLQNRHGHDRRDRVLHSGGFPSPPGRICDHSFCNTGSSRSNLQTPVLRRTLQPLSIARIVRACCLDMPAWTMLNYALGSADNPTPSPLSLLDVHFAHLNYHFVQAQRTLLTLGGTRWCVVEGAVDALRVKYPARTRDQSSHHTTPAGACAFPTAS